MPKPVREMDLPTSSPVGANSPASWLPSIAVSNPRPPCQPLLNLTRFLIPTVSNNPIRYLLLLLRALLVTVALFEILEIRPSCPDPLQSSSFAPVNLSGNQTISPWGL